MFNRNSNPHSRPRPKTPRAPKFSSRAAVLQELQGANGVLGKRERALATAKKVAFMKGLYAAITSAQIDARAKQRADKAVIQAQEDKRKAFQRHKQLTSALSQFPI